MYKTKLKVFLTSEVNYLISFKKTESGRFEISSTLQKVIRQVYDKNRKSFHKMKGKNDFTLCNRGISVRSR